MRSSDAHTFAPQMSMVAPRPAASQILTTTTTVIRYTYDPLQRPTSATYSDGKCFQYEYDAVGNRFASTQTITSTLVTTYTYDAANRLTSVNGVPYTWDANGVTVQPVRREMNFAAATSGLLKQAVSTGFSQFPVPAG